MPIWTLALKDLRLLVRDARAMVILLAMPFIFILVLGVSLGEGFGKKERLRVSVLNLDRGLPRLGNKPAREPWSQVVLRDLAQSAEISVELLDNLEQAENLVHSGRRPAILVLGPNFSKRVERCSFLAGGWGDVFLLSCALPRPGLPANLALAAAFQESQDALPLYFFDGINPFFRDGVKFEEVEVRVLKDTTQQAAAAIIDQVAQGTLLRVILPWMIGRAFEKLGDPEFIDLLSKENVKVPFGGFKIPLKGILDSMNADNKRELGTSLQNAIQRLYPKYNLMGKTWADLTRSGETGREGAGAFRYREDGSGLLKRGAFRYQLLVPSYLVMFAFFLVLTVGWLFVAERRQGTMKRLCVAPLSRTQILLGKLVPCFALSLAQGFFLLAAGKLVFGMSWGPEPLLLVPVVVTTSLAAMGLALLVAALAQTETQVAIYGTLLVLVLAGLSGTMMGDRSLMPETMQKLSLLTPHAWALDAYRQLVANPGQPNLQLIVQSCLMLALYGLVFIALAWWALKLDD